MLCQCAAWGACDVVALTARRLAGAVAATLTLSGQHGACWDAWPKARPEGCLVSPWRAVGPALCWRRPLNPPGALPARFGAAVFRWDARARQVGGLVGARRVDTDSGGSVWTRPFSSAALARPALASGRSRGGAARTIFVVWDALLEPGNTEPGISETARPGALRGSRRGLV